MIPTRVPLQAGVSDVLGIFCPENAPRRTLVVVSELQHVVLKVFVLAGGLVCNHSHMLA